MPENDVRASDAACLAGQAVRQFLDQFARFGGRTFKVGAARFVHRGDLERYIASRRSADAPADSTAPAWADVQTLAALRRANLLGIEREVVLRGLLGDAAEAESAGDESKAQLTRELVDMLRRVTYAWRPDLGRWQVTFPSGESALSGQLVTVPGVAVRDA